MADRHQWGAVLFKGCVLFLFFSFLHLFPLFWHLHLPCLPLISWKFPTATSPNSLRPCCIFETIFCAQVLLPSEPLEDTMFSTKRFWHQCPKCSPHFKVEPIGPVFSECEIIIEIRKSWWVLSIWTPHTLLWKENAGLCIYKKPLTELEGSGFSPLSGGYVELLKEGLHFREVWFAQRQFLRDIERWSWRPSMMGSP